MFVTKGLININNKSQILLWTLFIILFYFITLFIYYELFFIIMNFIIWTQMIFTLKYCKTCND